MRPTHVPWRLVFVVLTVDVCLLVFISVAGMVLLEGLRNLVVMNLQMTNAEGGRTMTIRPLPIHRRLLATSAPLLLIGLAAFAFTVVPGGVVFYVGR